MDIYIEKEGLASCAERAAAEITIRGSCSGRRAAALMGKAWRRIKDSEKRIALLGGTDKLPAAQWLADNLYSAGGEYARAAAELSAARRLPRAEKGLPAVLDLAGIYTDVSFCEFTEERAKLFLSGAQRSRYLSEREL
ncbi:MAG: hypothetical protein II784_03370, partial [Oscillospiraceae bacterium]|nr:hypothetical protein [Oscillospiraceae bacterium]